MINRTIYMTNIYILLMRLCPRCSWVKNNINIVERLNIVNLTVLLPLIKNLGFIPQSCIHMRVEHMHYIEIISTDHIIIVYMNKIAQQLN